MVVGLCGSFDQGGDDNHGKWWKMETFERMNGVLRATLNEDVCVYYIFNEVSKGIL